MDGVILLHGIGNLSVTMSRMEKALRADGYATCNLRYPSRRMNIDALADRLTPEISRFAAGLDGRLHFVCHSMGGLVARTWIARERPRMLGRVVMLAPPNGGSEIADLLHDTFVYRRVFGPAGAQLTTQEASARRENLGRPDYPVGVIAGDRTINPLSTLFILPRPSDGTVSVASSRLDGMADHIVVHASHSLLPFNWRAIDETRQFLRSGRFSTRG